MPESLEPGTDPREQTPNVLTNGGTVLEVFCVGLLSTVAAGILLSVISTLAVPTNLPGSARPIFAAVICLSYFGVPAAAGFIYGLKRRHRLNPLFVFIGWLIWYAILNVTTHSLLGGFASGFIRWCWGALGVLLLSSANTTATLLGSFVRKRRC